MERVKILFFLPLILYAGSCPAQLETSIGHIAGFTVDNWYEISIDSAILQRLSGLKQPKDQAFQFAFPVPVSLNPGNSGFIKNNGKEKIWTVGIHSGSAKSLNVILKPFHIPEGAYVYVYDRDRTSIRGAFGSENNNGNGVLPVMPVPGEWLILEYHIPSEAHWQGTLAISQVAHDFLGIFGRATKDDRFGMSQACNVDINCPAGMNYYDQKRSVCRIIVRGIELCTGALVNNTNRENRALLMTAQHCITGDNDAAASLFVFEYESPWCKGPDGYVYHSISGSVLRATNQNIDFSLVELSSFPPFTYHPYLAGWDVTGAVPNSGVAIHHPMGDVKKISTDLNQLVTDTYTGYITNGFWKVLQWNSGTTEGGSSGCPLFDQNKRIVGLLTGGEAQCGLSVNDYFAKLSYSYNLSPYLWMQLKGWIDPAVSGIKIYDGRDPYAPNDLTVDTLTNFLPAEQDILTPFTTGKGYSTGYNSDSLTGYAEYFKNPLAKQVSEVLMNIAVVHSVASSDSANIYILSDGVTPGSVLAHQKVLLTAAKDTFVIKIDFKSTIPVGGNFYVAWKIYYHSSAATETRQFAVFHSPARTYPSQNTAWFNDGFTWKQFTSHPFAPMSVSLDVRAVVVGNPVPSEIQSEKSEAPEFSVYPNPSTGKVFISTGNEVPGTFIRIYDVNGLLVFTKDLTGRFPGEVEADLTSLKKGLYYLVITSSGRREVHKLVIGQ